MPLVELQSPSGQIRQVEFDTDPTEADIEQVALELFGPAQGAIEAGARAVPLGFTKLLTQPVQAAANIQQSIRDIGGKYGGPLGEAVGIGLGQFAPGGYLAKPAGEFAGEVEAEAERLYAPDTESHPIATTVGGAIPQAMGMIGAGATLGPAAPLVLGGLSEAQGGFETAEEIGVTSPEARLGMGLGFGAVGAGFEATGGIGSKTAMTAIEEAAKRGFGATAKLAAKQALSETLEEPATGIGQDALTAIGALSAEDKKHPGRTVTGYDIGQLSMASPEYWQRRGLETIGGAVGGGLFGAVNLANRRQLLDRLAQNQGAAPLTTAAATAKIGQEAKQKAAQPPPIPPTVEGELPFEAPQPPPLPDTDYMEGDLTLEQAQAMADAEQAAIRTETAPESVLPGAAPPEAAPPEVAPELISETIPPEPGAVPQEQLTNAVPPVSSATSVAGQSEGKESVPIPPVAPAAAAPTTGEIQPQTQPPDATQEIVQPESLPGEPEGGIEGRETPETGVGDSLLGEAPSQPEGEVAPTPPLNKRGKAISRALQARGVDADLADDIARHVEGQNQDAQMEELLDAAYRAFEAAGGIYAGESPPYSEHYETYLATGLTEQEAQEAVQNAKFWNEQRANEERAHNQRLKKERQYATPKTEQGTGGIESPRITGETESGTIPQTDEPGESRGAPEPAAPPSKRPVAPWVESGLTEPGQTEGDLVADFGIELRAIQQEAGQPAETLFDLPEPQKRNLSQLREAVVAEIDRNEADPRRAELEDDDPAYVALENERRRLDTLLGRIEAKLMPRQEQVPAPDTEQPTAPTTEPPAQAAQPPSQSGKLSKQQIQTLLARGHEVAPAGPAYAAFRQSLLQSLTGTSVPKSKAGINAVENALFDAYGIDRKQTKAAMDDALRAALRAELEGPTEAIQPPAPDTAVAMPPTEEPKQPGERTRKPKLSVGESTARATEDRGEPISLKEAQDHLTSMGVKAPKVTVIHEPSLDWRGRYNEDGSITLNAGRIHSLEELDHVLFNHEAVHDAIENDPEVRKAAANLEAVLTKAEFDEITEIVRPYEPGERPDERMVEAVHILARGRPDLQSAWNRFVEAIRQAIAKFLGIKLPSRKEAELVAAQILARGRQRTMEGELGREGGAPLFSRYEDSPESDAAIAGFPRQREVKPETAEQEDVLKGWKDSEAKYAATATGGKVMNEMSYKQIVAQAKEWLGQYDSLLTALDAAKDIANTPLRLEVVDQILAEAWKKSVSSDPYRKAEGLKAIELAAIARQAIGEEWGQGGAFRRESYKTKPGMFAVLTTRGILKRRQEAKIKGKIRGGTAAAVQAIQGAVNRVDRILGGLIKGTPAPTERPQSTEGRQVLTKSDEELLDAELAEAADIDIDALEKAIAIADGILNKLAFTHKDPLEWGKKKPSRIHPIKALYNEHLGNPMEEQEFVDGMVALDVPEDLARKLFNAASMEIAARQRIKQTTANLQAEEMAEKTARRLVYRISKLHRQSGYIRTGKNLDTISKAFRDQVNSPLTWDEFRNRLQTLKVTEPTAAALFHVAQREAAAQAEMKRKALFDSLTSDTGMEKLLNQVRRKVAPDAVFWRDILADLPKQRQDQRQAEIFRRLRKHEAFRDLSLPEQLALARAMDRAWQKQRQKLFKSYLDKYDAFRARKKQDAVKLRETAPELFRLINLGMFGAETFRDLLAHKLGIGYMTDKEAAEIAQMAEKIQDMPHGYLRTVESMKLIRKMRQVAHATMGEILDSYWTSSVLSSPRTWTGILMSSVMSFVETANMAAKVGVMGKPTLAVKTMSDIFSELLPTIAEATMSVFTGDRTGTVGIEDHINAYLRDPANVRPPVSMARELMDRGGAAKAPAVVIGVSSRIMSALDQFASTATRKAQLRLAADLRGLSFPSREDIAVMRQRANDELFGGREPSTPAEWAQRRAYVRDAIDQTFPKEVTNSVNVIARSMALQNDPTGAVGIVYDAVNHMFGSMQRMAREAAVETREKALEKDEITVEDKLKVVSMDALSVLATIAKGLAGAKFIRALTNMVNYGASYMPGTALPVVRNALLSTLKKDDTRSMNTPEGRAVLQARNLVGLMAIGTLYTLLEYLADGGGADDDDLIGIEGDWRSLTPQQVNNRRSTKAIPLSIWWTDSKGVRHYHSYKNIPGLSMIYGAIGNAMDKARYHPDEWKAMSRSERLGYASLAIFSAPFQTSMASAWTSGGKPIREDFSTLTSLRDMIVNYAGGLFPAALKDIDYITDPVYRKPEGAAERFMFHIPFVRRFVGTEKTGVFGDKVELNRWPWGREFSMSNENAAYDNLQKLNRHGLFINPPGERKKQLISGGSREMTEDERQKYEQNVAEGYARYVLRQTDRLLKLPPEKAQATLNSDLDKIRDRAAGIHPSTRR